MNLKMYPGISVPIAIDYTDGGPTEGVDEEGMITASIPLLFQWPDREKLYISLKGGWVKRNGVLWYEPSTHRHWDYPQLAVKSISGVKGLAPRERTSTTNPLTGYEFGKCTVEYGGLSSQDREEQPEDRLDPDRPETAYELEINQSAKITTIKEGLLEIVDMPFPGSGTAKPFNGEMGILTVEAELNLKFPRISWVRPEMFKPYLGRINYDIMFGYGMGSVMFAGVQTSIEAATDGERRQSVSLSFLAQDRNWNVIIGETGAPKIVRFKGSTPVKYPFEFADLTQIFSGNA